jgi:hypothetical protein
MTRSVPAVLLALMISACGDEARLPVLPESPSAPGDAQLAKLQAGLNADDFEYTIIRHPDAPTLTFLNRINTRGDVVGHYFDGTRWDGFLRRGEDYHRISYPESDETVANGINERGDVVGTYVGKDGIQAFLFSDGEYQTLSAPAGYHTRAYDISSRGVIAGSYHTGSGKWQPAIWEKGVFTPLPVITQALGADMAEGFGINVHGQVVGHFTVAGEAPFPGTQNQKMYGFVYDRGQVIATLNVPGSGWMSCAFGIGVHGEAVGHYSDIAAPDVLVSGYVWRDGAYVARLVVPNPGAENPLAMGTYPMASTPNGIIAGYAILADRTPTGGFEPKERVGFIAVQKKPGRR